MIEYDQCSIHAKPSRNYQEVVFFSSFPTLDWFHKGFTVSDVEFQNVDLDELGLFLMLTASKESLQSNDVLKFCPTRKSKGRTPTLTASGINKKPEKRWSGWTKSNCKPESSQAIKELVTYALRISLLATLQNHIYTFDRKLYQQLRGGAIGVGIAGDVALLFMVWWDRELKQRLQSKGISLQMYSRYVDDINLVAKAIPNKTDEQNDKVTMQHIKEIANEIHTSIKVTIDYPSNHSNNRMPVLDLEQWIENIQVNNKEKHQILFSHYMKPMSSKHLIKNSSALSPQTRISILVADLVRIMRNVSSQCQNDERRQHIQHFVQRMQYSGYNQQQRVQVYKRAKRKFDNIIEKDRKGECPMYRSKSWERGRRDREKAEKKKTWYAKGGFETVLFVDSTPNSELAKQCQKALREAELKIRVVERAGQSIKQALVRSNPLNENSCKQDDCKTCQLNPKANCKSRDIVYRITCVGSHEEHCGESYVGESSRSLGERINEHMHGYEKEDKNLMLFKHIKEKHGGVRQELKIEKLATFPGDAMLRQVTEAVFINETTPALNSKEEWGNTNVPRPRYNYNNVFCDNS